MSLARSSSYLLTCLPSEVLTLTRFLPCCLLWLVCVCGLLALLSLEAPASAVSIGSDILAFVGLEFFCSFGEDFNSKDYHS